MGCPLFGLCVPVGSDRLCAQHWWGQGSLPIGYGGVTQVAWWGWAVCLLQPSQSGASGAGGGKGLLTYHLYQVRVRWQKWRPPAPMPATLRKPVLMAAVSFLFLESEPGDFCPSGRCFISKWISPSHKV